MNDAAWTKHLSQPSFLYPSTDADIRLIPVSLCSVHYNYSPAESGFLQSVVTVLVETHWGDQCCVTSLTLLTTTSSHSACSVECKEFCVTISQQERGFAMILHNYDTNIFENTGLNNCSWLNCTNSSVSLFSRNNFGRLFACNYSSCHIYIDRCRSLFFSWNNVVSSLI